MLAFNLRRMTQMVSQNNLIYNNMRFYGKTESGYKYKTPKLKMRCVNPIPPPGLSLRPPSDLTPLLFCRQIGGDCEEYADKFETTDELFDLTSYQMKERGVPVVNRKYILRCRELLRRGLLTFEYLNRRTCLDKCR